MVIIDSSVLKEVKFGNRQIPVTTTTSTTTTATSTTVPTTTSTTTSTTTTTIPTTTTSTTIPTTTTSTTSTTSTTTSTTIPTTTTSTTIPTTTSTTIPTTTTTVPTTTTTSTTTTTTSSTTTTTIEECVDEEPPVVEVQPYDDYIQSFNPEDHRIYDSYMDDLRVCVNMTDDCGADVQFRYKWNCDPWTNWIDYDYNEGIVYCYNITREGDKGWANLVDDKDGISWGYRAYDLTGKETVDYVVDVIHVWDDDVDPPEFTAWEYLDVVRWDNPIYVRVTITDESGIASAKFYYDYNNDGIAEGDVDPYEVSHGRYSYIVPAPCPGLTKDQCIDLGLARIHTKFWIEAADGDDDREGDSITWIETISIFIDPPGDEVPELHEPHIKGYMPGPSEVEIIEGRVVRFIVYADDPDDDELTYDWQLDGESVSSETNYAYKPDHSESGVHELVVYISDGENEISQAWTINVIDKVCDWELEEEETTTTTTINNVVNNPPNNNPPSGSGSSGGGGGGGSSQTTTTLEVTTTILPEEEKESIVVTQQEDNGEDKSPITGKVSLVDFKYVIGSFVITVLLGLGLLKLIPLGKKKTKKKSKSAKNKSRKKK